jgi:hypothetical protein
LLISGKFVTAGGRFVNPPGNGAVFVNAGGMFVLKIAGGTFVPTMTAGTLVKTGGALVNSGGTTGLTAWLGSTGRIS